MLCVCVCVCVCVCGISGDGDISIVMIEGIYVPLLRGVAKMEDGHVTLAPREIDDIVERVKVIKARLAKGEQVGLGKREGLYGRV